ncbi:hypothetical protein HW555_005347 [Spodoptera exigua]|uniref:PHD-type domain-containing protein n=1 Tax=Spodoptera exigua TaxID=7107 RepID=A0A835L7I9_SPOEX|nr:hypothetical protein HW555_005347 [Spodoptera exigua]
MICRRCQRSLRSSEGLKCGICESCFHMRCVSDSVKDNRESGDKGYQWKCSLCQNYVSAHTSGSDVSCKEKDHAGLMAAVSAISEKFELVNKIQLPKLNSELAQIKSVADRIVQQNDDILRKINEIDEKRKNEKHYCTSNTRYRRRNISLTPKPIPTEIKEETPALTDKNVSFQLLVDLWDCGSRAIIHSSPVRKSQERDLAPPRAGEATG